MYPLPFPPPNVLGILIAPLSCAPGKEIVCTMYALIHGTQRTNQNKREKERKKEWVSEMKRDRVKDR